MGSGIWDLGSILNPRQDMTTEKQMRRHCWVLVTLIIHIMIRRRVHFHHNYIFPTVNDGGVGKTSSVLVKSLTLGNDIGLEGMLASDSTRVF